MAQVWADYKSPFGVKYLMDADRMNELRNNFEWLASPPVALYEHSTTGGDYTTNAQINMVEIDSTNMRLSIDHTEGGLVVAVFMGVLSFATINDTIALDFSVDGDKISRHGAFGSYAGWGVEVASRPVGLAVAIPLIRITTPGTYVISPVWATLSGNTATLIDDFGVSFGVWEA